MTRPFERQGCRNLCRCRHSARHGHDRHAPIGNSRRGADLIYYSLRCDYFFPASIVSNNLYAASRISVGKSCSQSGCSTFIAATYGGETLLRLYHRGRQCGCSATQLGSSSVWDSAPMRFTSCRTPDRFDRTPPTSNRVRLSANNSAYGPMSCRCALGRNAHQSDGLSTLRVVKPATVRDQVERRAL